MKNKSKHLKIRKIKMFDFLLVAVASILVIFVTGLFFVQTNNAKQGQIELVQDVMAKTAENQKDLFEAYVDEKITVLKTLATYPDIYEMSLKKQRDFIRGRSGRWGFSHIFVMDMNGMGFYIDDNIRKDQSREEFFYNIKNNDIYITSPFYQATGKIIVTVCVSIYDTSGMKVGILCGAVRLNSIQSLIRENEVILDGNTFILNDEGIYVTSKNEEDVSNRAVIFATPNSELSLISKAINKREDMAGQTTLNGVLYQTHITYLKDYDWMIVQNIPVDNIVSRYSTFNQIQTILTVSVLILISCILRIVHKWKKSDRKIYRDQLTRCNSRAAFYDLLEQLEHNYKHRITIVYMDLNDFKDVNDTYGHDEGDNLLKIFADVLIRTLGKEAFVGRVGGDEFVAVLIDITDAELFEIWKMVERSLAEESTSLSYNYRISSSYGYASREKGAKDNLSDVLVKADQKMYQFKTKMKAFKKQQS